MTNSSNFKNVLAQGKAPKFIENLKVETRWGSKFFQEGFKWGK